MAENEIINCYNAAMNEKTKLVLKIAIGVIAFATLILIAGRIQGDTKINNSKVNVELTQLALEVGLQQ